MPGPRSQVVDELNLRLSGVIRIGMIYEVDHANARLRVRIEGQERSITDWIPWPGVLGRNRVEWMPLKVGQIVVLACQSGDMRMPFVVGFLYDSTDPPPSTDETLDVVRFRSGTTVQHDADTGDLLITAARHVTVNVTGDVTINATGNVDIDGARIDLN